MFLQTIQLPSIQQCADGEADGSENGSVAHHSEEHRREDRGADEGGAYVQVVKVQYFVLHRLSGATSSCTGASRGGGAEDRGGEVASAHAAAADADQEHERAAR